MYIEVTDDEIIAARKDAIEKILVARSSDRASGGDAFDGFDSGSFGFHEALHTASLMVDNVDRHLLEHPAIVLDPDLYYTTYKAFDQLCKLYQMLGDKHH